MTNEQIRIWHDYIAERRALQLLPMDAVTPEEFHRRVGALIEKYRPCGIFRSTTQDELNRNLKEETS